VNVKVPSLIVLSIHRKQLKRLSMKKQIISAVSSTLIILTIGTYFQNCSSTINTAKEETERKLKNEKGQYKYEWIPKQASDFKVDYAEWADRKMYPHLISYIVDGRLKNNTGNIYKKVSIKLIMLFELENGNILSGAEMNYSKLLGPCVDFTVWSNWKPSEEKEISNLSSCYFSTEYADYPIKKVISQCQLELEDQINGTNETIINSQSDVTAKWKQAVAIVKRDSKGINK
jgi:hypothetical protein